MSLATWNVKYLKYAIIKNGLKSLPLEICVYKLWVTKGWSDLQPQ